MGAVRSLSKYRACLNTELVQARRMLKQGACRSKTFVEARTSFDASPNGKCFVKTTRRQTAVTAMQSALAAARCEGCLV